MDNQTGFVGASLVLALFVGKHKACPYRRLRVATIPLKGYN